MLEDKVNKISFFAKNITVCPVCQREFRREELLSGGGRMNAGKLTDELHREFIPTQKFGEIHPLIYLITVCPSCLYATYTSDFENVPDDKKELLLSKKSDRTTSIKTIFPRYNFDENRQLRDGIGSYLLAIMCYDYFDSSFCPTFKQGLSALRAAWLCNDLNKSEPSENYDFLRDVFYRKARFFYTEVIESEKEGRENYDEISHFGPDIDHNHGYDGVLYLTGLLEYKYGPKNDIKARINNLNTAKITVARIVGMGKSSKSKPSDFVEGARELHGKIKEEIKILEESLE